MKTKSTPNIKYDPNIEYELEKLLVEHNGVTIYLTRKFAFVGEQHQLMCTDADESLWLVIRLSQQRHEEFSSPQCSIQSILHYIMTSLAAECFFLSRTDSGEFAVLDPIEPYYKNEFCRKIMDDFNRLDKSV